jgi:methionyl-tRNA formyltransferase
MRIAFAGTPPFAAQALQALVAAGHEVALVLTQPDRPAGRGLQLQTSAVKRCALEAGLPVLQPRSLRLDGRYPQDAEVARAALYAAAPQVLVVAAYGLILPPWTLQQPPHGSLNIHASLLPRWRGAAPIQRAIEAGDTQTGITIMQMDAGLDTGDLLLAEAEPIRPDDSAGSLQDRLAARGARLIVQTLQRLTALQAARAAQPAQGVTYAHKIDKAEAVVDWTASAVQIARRLRAFDPAPGCSTLLDGQLFKLWAGQAHAHDGASAAPGTLVRRTPQGLWVACGDGLLQLEALQAPGGRRLPVAEFQRSPAARGWTEGQRLGRPGET